MVKYEKHRNILLYCVSTEAKDEINVKKIGTYVILYNFIHT